jgi:hypothetical protein
MKWTPVWCFLLILSGCASQPQRAPSSASLESWVQQQLTPYLIDNITQHPRLKNETFAVVRMSEGDMQAQIDGLTLQLRQRITENLAAAPGVHMAWLPAMEHRHHRRLANAECGNPLQASYFIGIDSQAMSGADWRVSVRLFDASEGAWVSGKSLTWRGRIRPDQRRASQQTRDDELLRGLRTLPFSSGQSDLAAAYFANNLSCLMRQRGLSESRIHVAPLANKPVELTRILSLLDNYLSRLHQARITGKRQDAEYIIQPELQRIDQDLYQLWISLQPQGSAEHVAGLDTAAYIRLAAERQTAPNAAAPPIATRPPTQPLKPRITELALLHPATPGLCDAADPWALGRLPIEGGEAVSSMDCFLVRTRAEHSKHLFLLLHTPDGRLQRIAPGRCDADGPVTEDLAAARLYPAHQRPLRMVESPGVGTLYAVAVADEYVAKRLQRHVERLPDGCAPSSSGEEATNRLDTWTRQLDRLLALRPQTLDWTALRLHFYE